jgi:hypothetical protein
MNNIRLTTRGKIVLAVLAVLAGYLVASAALGAVTPDECKVPNDQMTQGCIALIYK